MSGEAVRLGGGLRLEQIRIERGDLSEGELAALIVALVSRLPQPSPNGTAASTRRVRHRVAHQPAAAWARGMRRWSGY